MRADPENRFAAKNSTMAKSKKKVKQSGASKFQKKEGMKDPDRIISEIEEETRVLKGIVSRFSKPISNGENE